MQNIAIRFIIVLFGLVAAFGVGSLLVAEPRTSPRHVQAAADAFFAAPSEGRFRSFLNLVADGEGAHLKMALVGLAFVEHPDLYRSVFESPATDLEREWLGYLPRLGAGVFEYDPSLKPAEFDSAFQSATWLNP